MANNRKLIPYGISNFEKVRLENYYYVDKTGYIPNLESYNYILFLRPRRFGKSLFLNMLEAYYSTRYADKFDSLFGDLEIGKHPTEIHSSYLTLRFSFASVNSNPDKVEESFNWIALKTIESFVNVNATNLPQDTYNRVINGCTSCHNALFSLANIISECGKKLYVMIDEYDNFANTLMTVDENKYSQIMHADGSIRLFYNLLKDASAGNGCAIDRIFITGVSPLCLSDVTSGFNIAANLSTEPRFNAMVGFSENDVRIMLTYYAEANDIPLQDAESQLPLMKSYYDNYCFSEEAAEDGEHVFNSDMTLYFIDKFVGRRGKAPNVLLDDNVKQDFNKIRMMVRYESSFGNRSSLMQSILNDGYTLAQLNTQFQIRELTDESNLSSLLFYLGMLTYGKATPPEGGGRSIVTLVVANEAMRQQYAKYLAIAYADTLQWRTDINTMNKLWANWSYFGQWQPLITHIASAMHDNDSVRDFTPQAESFIKGFILAHLYNIKGFIVRTEAEMSHGYSDIYLYPIVPEFRNALVLELKYLKPTATDTEVENARKEAHKQIAQYVADKRLRTEAEAKGWTLVAAVAVFRGWTAEVIEELTVNS